MLCHFGREKQIALESKTARNALLLDAAYLESTCFYNVIFPTKNSISSEIKAVKWEVTSKNWNLEKSPNRLYVPRLIF